MKTLKDKLVLQNLKVPYNPSSFKKRETLVLPYRVVPLKTFVWRD